MSNTDDDVDVAVTAQWAASCKDCRTRRGLKRDNPPPKGKGKGKGASKKPSLAREAFDYSDNWATRTLERGGSRSDRCPECRRTHSQEIRAFPVAYIDIAAIGRVQETDPAVGPSGPLGGLGPLPDRHLKSAFEVKLSQFKLGLTGKDILDLIAKMAASQVVILEAGTGTGKSTLAPFRLMNPPPGAVYRPTDFGPIIVTEPRIPATTEVAKFVGEAMCFGHDPAECTQHVGPGYPVGYQCDGKKVWDEACRLIYVTDGSLINWIKNGDLARFSTVVIDEAHERSENIDTILALLHQSLPRFPDLKVLIASATIDKRLFEEFFADVTTVDHHFVEATKSIGYGVPLFAGPRFPPDGNIDALLEFGLTLADPANPGGKPLLELPGWRADPEPETDDLNLRAVTASLLDLRRQVETDPSRWLNTMPEACAEQSFKLVEAIVAGEIPAGDVLAFLPTETTVLEARALLEKRLEGRGWPVAALWLMKATPDKEKERALAECKPGEFKVVFASNLAETSLTIAGMRYVVDSGLICQAEWDPKIAASTAPVRMHSQSGVRQRWGRVGRKTFGWVFPLYSAEQFLTMPRDTPAGSTQTSLEQMYLKLAAAGVDDLGSVKLPANFHSDLIQRDPHGQQSADNFTLESKRSLRALVANGAMTSDGRLTSLGRELERSRLSPERTMALLFADRLACVPEVALALIALDAGALVGPDRLLRESWKWPSAWCIQAHHCHKALAIGCTDDLDLVLRIFSDWESAPDPSAWAQTWWVDELALETIREQVLALIDAMAPGMSKEASRPFNLALTGRARAVLSRALTSAHYQRQQDGQFSPLGTRSSTEDDWPREAATLGDTRLVWPGDTVVALSRERPRARRGQGLSPSPVVHGLVNVVNWACRAPGEVEGPEPFDLMLRARRHLRQADDQLLRPSDPLRSLRSSLPIGTYVTAQVRRPEAPAPSAGNRRDRIRSLLRGRQEGPEPSTELNLTAVRVRRAPFTLPEQLPSRPGGRTPLVARAPRTARQVYTGGGLPGRETTGDVRRRGDNQVAGVEDAPEELTFQPQVVTDLEVERFHSELAPVATFEADNILDETDRVSINLQASAYGPVELPVGPEFNCIIVGYTLLEGVGGVVLEPIDDCVIDRADPAFHDDLDIGDDVEVITGELVRTSTGTYRALHRCTADGQPDGKGTFYFYGPSVDEYDDASAEVLAEGGRWDAKVLAWSRPEEPQSISLIGDMYERIVTEFSLRESNAKTVIGGVPVLGSLVGGAVVVEEHVCRIVALDAPNALGLHPRFVVRVRPVAAATTLEEALPDGTRVGIRLEARVGARRSGRWTDAQLDQLERTAPSLFVIKDGNVNLATNAPLDEAGLDALLELEPGDPAADHRVWRLWETSRHLGTSHGGGKSSGLVHGTEAIANLQAEFNAELELNRQSITAREAIVGRARELSETASWQLGADEFAVLMQEWKTAAPVPREISNRLYEEFMTARAHFFERRASHATLEKEQLISRMRELVQAESARAAQDESKRLTDEWKLAGSAGEHDDDLWERFRTARSEGAKHWEARADLVKRQLIAEATSLATSSDLRLAAEGHKQLMVTWKAAGSAGKTVDNALWAEFDAARETLRDRQAAAREDCRRLKTLLIKEARKLADFSDLKTAGEAQKSLMSRWKTIGSAGRELDNELYSDFKAARDSYYAHVEHEHEGNERAKALLVARAEQIAQLSNWKEVSAEFRALRDQWKLIGSAGHDDDNALWARLNAAHDLFKARQRVHFGR